MVLFNSNSYFIHFRILASLNLPAALEDTTGNSLPQSLREKSQAIREKGGIDTVQGLLNELPSLLQRNNEILKEVNFLYCYIFHG